ncbi:MAG TPA: response regulator [Candidatus Methylacidiphilales bacterium]
MKPIKSAPVILIVDDDEGHALLVRDSLQEAGLSNSIEHFADGQTVLDFFFHRGPGPYMEPGQAYVVLLDIRMPKVDGVEVLRQIKADPKLHKLPIIMLTTTEDPREVTRCHELGCNVYLQKPVDYGKFAEAMRRLGMFITLLLVPPVTEHA